MSTVFLVILGIWSWFVTADANRTIQNVWYILSIGGIVVAIVLHRVKVRQDRRIAMGEKYTLLQGRWIRFLELSLQYPQLDFGPQRMTGDTVLSNSEEYQQYQLFNILVSIFEEVWLLRDLIPYNQWAGWDEYITDYCNSPVFRKLWFHALEPETEDGQQQSAASSQYDKKFDEFMMEKFKRLVIDERETRKTTHIRRNSGEPSCRASGEEGEHAEPCAPPPDRAD
jgi:hypothetical protein